MRTLVQFFLHRPHAGDKGVWGCIRWTRVAACVAAGGVAGYLLLATAFFAYARFGQELRELRFTDVVLPIHWSRYDSARGNQLIAIAHQLARENRIREARMFAQEGLARTPAHREGRLLLTRLLAATSQVEAAGETFLAGLSFHRNDSRFLNALFRHLLQRHEDERIVSLARELLADPSTVEDCARIAAVAGTTASCLRGDYSQAAHFLHSVSGLEASREGRLLAARIEWGNGARDSALTRLKGLATEFPLDPAIQTELIARLRDAGLHAESCRAGLTFQFAQPKLVAARIALLQALHAAGDQPAIGREIESALRDFPADAAALLALGDFAANTGDPALARRLASHVRRHELPAESHALLVIEALLVARDFRGALEAIHEQARETSSPSESRPAPLDGLHAVAAFGMGDFEVSRVLLASFLNRPGLPADHLLALANRFAALDASEEARAILKRATFADPHHAAAIARLVELDLNLNRIDELPAHLLRLLATRNPSPDLLRVAQHKLGSDLFLFSEQSAPALEAVRLALERHAARRPAF